jgi:hypothetical protein
VRDTVEAEFNLQGAQGVPIHAARGGRGQGKGKAPAADGGSSAVGVESGRSNKSRVSGALQEGGEGMRRPVRRKRDEGGSTEHGTEVTAGKVPRNEPASRDRTRKPPCQ